MATLPTDPRRLLERLYMEVNHNNQGITFNADDTRLLSAFISALYSEMCPDSAMNREEFLEYEALCQRVAEREALHRRLRNGS